MQNTPSAYMNAFPDPSWKSLYLAGAVSAVLYIGLGIVVPALLYMQSGFDPDSSGIQTLQFINTNRAWWITEQTLVLAPSMFAIVTFMALFAALKDINKSYAAIGVMGAIVCQILFLAYFPIVMGLVELSDQYAVAVLEAERNSLVAAADSLVAQNRSIGPSEAIFAFSVLIISLIMLKGIFHKSVAYLGIATCVAYVIGMAFRPVIGVAYLSWWAFFLVWFMAVAWTLFGLAASASKNA